MAQLGDYTVLSSAGKNHQMERFIARGPDGRLVSIRQALPPLLENPYLATILAEAQFITRLRHPNLVASSPSERAIYRYFAPERVHGRPFDRRSDIWSLGVMLYELTTRVILFRADSDLQTFHAIVNEPLPALVPGYPPAFAAIVHKALANDPNDRYATALELRTDILTALDARDFRGELATLMNRLFAAVPT